MAWNARGASIIQLFSISPTRGEISPYRDPQRLLHEDMGESANDSHNLCFSSLLGIVKCTGDGDKIQRPLKKPLSPLGQFSPQVHASTSRKLLSRDKDGERSERILLSGALSCEHITAQYYPLMLYHFVKNDKGVVLLSPGLAFH